MNDMSNGNGSGGTVHELNASATANMHPTLARVHRYWDQQRKGRIVPSRSDIDPGGLEGALGNVFIIERISTGLARFRIAGTKMNDLIGLDVRGMPLSAIFNAPDRERLADGLEAVFDHPAVLHLLLESSGGFGRKDLSGSMLLLPLRSDLGEVSRALGVVSMEGQIGRTPRRMSILSDARTGLTGFGGPEAAQARTLEDASSSQRPITTPRPPRRTLSQHLRLVADNTLPED